MPAELFVQQEDEQGEITYVALSEVESPDVALPETLVREHEIFKTTDTDRKNAIQESKKYRKRAQTAEAALREDEPDGDEPETPETQQQSSTEIDVDALYATFRQRLTEEAQQLAETKTKQETIISTLIKDHKLGHIEGIESILTNSADPASTAATLGRQAMQFGDGSGGETPYTGDVDNVDGVYALLGLPLPK